MKKPKRPSGARLDRARARLARVVAASLAARPARRAALAAKRDTLAGKRAEMEARLAARKRPKKKEKKRRWIWVLLVLLFLFLLWICSCGPDPIPPELGDPAPVEVEPAEPVEPEPPPLTIPRRDRPSYPIPPPKPLTWLGSFRMQVSARSPRLAACFEGADAPGQLKWTTSVEPVEGRVSEHTLEPMLTSGDLTAEQKACVFAALESPPYNLRVSDEQSTPSRVGLVIEF